MTPCLGDLWVLMQTIQKASCNIHCSQLLRLVWGGDCYQVYNNKNTAIEFTITITVTITITITKLMRSVWQINVIWGGNCYQVYDKDCRWSNKFENRRFIRISRAENFKIMWQKFQDTKHEFYFFVYQRVGWEGNYRVMSSVQWGWFSHPSRRSISHLWGIINYLGVRRKTSRCPPPPPQKKK